MKNFIKRSELFATSFEWWQSIGKELRSEYGRMYYGKKLEEIFIAVTSPIVVDEETIAIGFSQWLARVKANDGHYYFNAGLKVKYSYKELFAMFKSENPKLFAITSKS